MFFAFHIERLHVHLNSFLCLLHDNDQVESNNFQFPGADEHNCCTMVESKNSSVTKAEDNDDNDVSMNSSMFLSSGITVTL